MLRREDYFMIQAKRHQGMYVKDIAADLGVHPKTVSRALRRGEAPTRRRGRPPGQSKLDPFKPTVARLLHEGVWNAVVIWRELQALGYTGKSRTLRDYIRPKRPLRPSRATVRFETAPGEQLQHDWGELVTTLAGIEQRVFVAVNTLGYSRRFHAWAAPCCDAEHTYESLVRCFEYFQGVPQTVWVDNQKAAVIAHRIGQAVEFNPRFLDLAGHYGFTPHACRPYRAQTKGKDERNVGYVKHHFFVRYRAFESLDELNAKLEHWLGEEADRRVHGTVKEVVQERFAREAPHLAPLPAVRFDTSYRESRFVAWDGYVEVRGNRYSVPAALCGQAVIVRLSLDGTVRIYDRSDTLVATHGRKPAPEGWATVPAHHAELWRHLSVERRSLAVYEEVLCR